MSRRKFDIGDTVKVTKQGRYNALQGLTGTVLAYRLRKYGGFIGGSCYTVRFVGLGSRTIETEYLTKVGV